VLVRRITLALCALFLAAVVAASVADRQQQKTQATAPPTTVVAGPPEPVVSGRLPGDGTVRARVGDAVTIAVRTEQPDEASIDELGVNAPTSSDVPGMLEFVASAPGRYAVRLTDSGTRAGTIVIARAR
jgi:FtsP/CotA-like multicopper oxidase with cupredoxin domain